MTPSQAFAEAMRVSGIETSDPIYSDGKMHRIHVEGDKRGTKNGWYVLHEDGIPAGQFGHWKTGVSQTWCGKNDNELTADERKAYRDRIKQQQRERELVEASLRMEAANRARDLWEISTPVNDHPYLERKGILAHCCRLYKDRLVVPMRDAQGMLKSLQFIGGDGTKRFLSNGQKRGCYATIGKPGDTILIAEGFATAATLHEATGYAVVIAFDAGNLEPVSKVIRDKFPAARIVICGDNDQFTDGNPGVSAAQAAAKPIGATVAIPTFEVLDEKPTDWNDFARLYGNAAILPKMGTIEPLSGTTDQTALSAANDNDLPMLTVDTHSPLPDTNDKGRPLATIENLGEVCRRLGVTIRYNVISKEEEIIIPQHGFSIDNQANASLAWLSSWCARFRMPTDKLADFVTYLADSNPFNPVAEWIMSKPWDGVYRLKDLCDTIEATNNDLKCVLILRWMVSAVAAAFEPDGVSAHGVLVLQGDQYLGKTKWFKTLVPAHLGVIQDGLMLRPDDRDSVKQCVSNWLVELGEIDSTFRKSDIAQLKSFITKKNDVIRRAYARKESNYARRTVFFGSVNPKQYLHDATGNRRFWTIEATRIDHSHKIDMQQLWAEIHHYWRQGEEYYLTPEEMDQLNDHNEEYTVVDPIQERLQSKLDWDQPKPNWSWRTATEILMEIGIERPNQSEVTKAAGFLRDMNGGNARRSNGKNLLFAPRKPQF